MTTPTKKGTPMKIKAIIAVASYALAITLANVLTNWFGLVPVGFGMLVTAGTYAAGLALLARDFVQRYAGTRWVLAGIGFGVVLSWFLASPALALASAAAFALAELADLLVYAWVRPAGFVPAAAASNVISAPIDTVVFLAIAGFPLTFDAMAGQLVGKLFWATFIPLALYVAVREIRRRAREALTAA
ncbi:VUT family protein [Microbacterium trichothecenolyticum]|uniref:Vitamin uptake transporter n=1 Tax=Microbacterium trichothecenolyticum TaxID=69370 RepID=A0A0M2HMA6_MICTR|nr:VUT family protein [Microbacterium trichothecenolyticum]KJL45583.1 hypothetical protein RS82_00135 [Microbacterium trichothecenolyticum]